MKKTYKNPSLEVVKIQTVGMIATSLNPGSGKGTVSSDFVTSGTAGEGHDDDFDW